jgi:energy-converting hydrogenase Eha subunit B
MSVVLIVLLIAFCIQGLVKFAVGFAVPYRTRISRIGSYYCRDGRVIGIYDSVTLVIIVALIALLFLTEMQPVSFITGLVAGMLIIQVFFHRFSEPLTAEQAPETDAEPRKVMSYAIQARPGLAWREIALMTALFGWALYQLILRLVG